MSNPSFMNLPKVLDVFLMLTCSELALNLNETLAISGCGSHSGVEPAGLASAITANAASTIEMHVAKNTERVFMVS